MNTSTNIFSLNKKGENKYIRVDKKGQLQIQIFRLEFANKNTNTNICHTQLYAFRTSKHVVLHPLHDIYLIQG